MAAFKQYGDTRRPQKDAWEDDDVMVAGQRVSAGRYRRVDVADGRVIEVAEGDYLPASLDGRVAIYEKVRGPAAGERIGAAREAKTSASAAS